MKKWLLKKNNAFSLISGECVNNKDVVMAHIGVVVFFAICLFADWMAS